MVRFAPALMNGRIVKPDTLTQMWTPAKIAGNGKPSTYGLGFGVLTIDGEMYVAHGRVQLGISNYLAIIPGKHFAVAALANMDDVDPFSVVRDILDQFNMPHPKPTARSDAVFS